MCLSGVFWYRMVYNVCVIRMLQIISEGDYPDIKQQSAFAFYPQGGDTMKIAEDLKFFIENKIKTNS